MKELIELEKLKRRLLKQEPSEKDLVYTLCRVMKEVGGYEQLLNLSLPALHEIIDYLNYLAREEEKAYQKVKNKRR
jgi:hypothetical protein